ncbi:MAG: hypothetical protein HY673_12255 [Chloroflexi bacterium]|nr:hypothetical protein [Chloroflexota bacterium]
MILTFVLVQIFGSHVPVAAQDVPNSVERTAGPPAERTWQNLPPEPPAGSPSPKERPVGLKSPAQLRSLKEQPAAPSRDASPGAPQSSPEQDSQAVPLAPSPLLVAGFEAADNSVNLAVTGARFIPPDPVIAAGPDHVMVVVNTMFQVYTKSGVMVRQASLKNWFSDVYAGPEYPFDPRIAYDQAEGRWLMLALIQAYDPAAIPPIAESWYLLSVSQTSNPTGNWWNYRLQGKLTYNSQETWADFPDLGFDGIPANVSPGGAVYITSNQFTFSSDVFATSMLNVLPKSALYTGSAFTAWTAWGRTNDNGEQAFTLRAAHTFGNPGGEFLINTEWADWDRVTIWRVVPGSPPVWTKQATINIGSYTPPPDAEQPGGSARLSTTDNRILNAVYRDGYLYAAFSEARNWGSGTVAAVRYLKINVAANSAEINATYGADGQYYFYPAIHTDSSGNIVIVFARSSSTEYGSVWYTGRKTTDSTAQPATLLKGGEKYIAPLPTPAGYAVRWGDYSGAAPDPVEENRVWIFGEWAKDAPGIPDYRDWGTWVGLVTFATPAPTPTVTPTPSPSPSPSPFPSPAPTPSPTPAPTPTTPPAPTPSPSLLPGDVNRDGTVNATDLDLLMASFNRRSGEAGFNPHADFNGDRIVDVYDLVIVGLNFGR